MLLILLAVLWVALLAPIVVRHFRDGGAERSIESFHHEHEALSRQDYRVEPAHRLDEHDEHDEYDEYLGREPAPRRRPRLTVVHEGDTYRSLAARTTWDEWSDDYAFDDGGDREERPTETPAATNHYARAYASRPDEIVDEGPRLRRTMRSRRRVLFTRTVVGAVALSVAAAFTRNALAIDVAALAWFLVVLYVALALYAISQGYLDDRTVWTRRAAPFEPLATSPRAVAAYDDVDVEEWEDAIPARRAFG